MSSVPGKFLNSTNIVKKVFDEENDAIRVSSPGITEVVIDAASGDNIAIKHSDGGDITPARPLPVSIDQITIAEVEIKNDIGNPVPISTVNGALETTQQNVLSELQTIDTSLNIIEGDTVLIKNAVQSLDTDIDVALSTRSSELTQQQVLAEAVLANASLDAIESDVDNIRLAAQSIDANFDVTLSTRASEATQLDNLTELQNINTELDSQSIILQSIDQSTNDIETAIESLDIKFDVALSTRNAESTQQQVLTEIQTANSSLDAIESDVDSINSKLNTLGQKTSTNSVPVVFASDQSTLPISTTQLPASLSSRGNLKVEPVLAMDYSRGVFGAARVVTTQNVFETLFSFDKQSTVWDEVLTSGGTSTWNSNTRSVEMTLPTTSGASVIRQTFRRVRYNPSRAVQLLTAATFGTGKVNVRKRIGQFDESDGLFFEQDGTTIYVVRRSSTSGSAVDTRTAQASWNIDRFDGTGPSGITIDFSKHQAFFIQYALQGFADITYGFYLNGQVVFCHKEVTANVLAIPFMKTGHLPARLEITNTGTSASTTTLSYNSFCIKNEGEDSETEGQVRSYSSGGIKTVGATTTPVLSVRLGPGFEKAIADILATTIFVQTTDEVIWTVWLGPTLTGSTFAITASYTQIDIAATTMTGGIELLSGILSQTNSSTSISQELLKLVNSLIGSSIGGTSQIITLAGRSRIGSADVLSSLVWREYP